MYICIYIYIYIHAYSYAFWILVWGVPIQKWRGGKPHILVHFLSPVYVAHMILVTCMNVSCHTHIIFESCRTYDWVMSHMWMRLVAYANESCRTYEWVAVFSRSGVADAVQYVVSRCVALLCVAVCCSALQCVAVSCSVFCSVQRFMISSCKDGHPPSRHKCAWVMSHTRLCDNATYGWVMSHIWMSRVSHMKESCLVDEWVISLTRLSHDATKKERKKATRARVTLHSSFFACG